MYRDKPNANSLNVRIYAKFRKFAKPSIRAPSRGQQPVCSSTLLVVAIFYTVMLIWQTYELLSKAMIMRCRQCHFLKPSFAMLSS
jgi:hypothetical protein